jgi:hypothetical protein
VKEKYGIDWVDLYGGEITILPHSYVVEMLQVIRQHYTGTISVITNFVKPSPMFFGDKILFKQPDYRTAVSYDSYI